jgi:hypothetical protein
MRLFVRILGLLEPLFRFRKLYPSFRNLLFDAVI